MKSTIQGFLGGILGAAFVGIVYAATVTWFGPQFPLGSENVNTVIGVNGDIAFNAQNTGPSYGQNSFGMGFRNTAEFLFDPAFVMRGNSYIFEGMIGPNPLFDLREYMSLNSTGMILGKAWSDALPYPQDRFNIRRGNMSLQAVTALEESGIVWRVAGEPMWFMGRLPASFGTGDDFVLYKWKNGSWTQMQRWAY